MVLAPAYPIGSSRHEPLPVFTYCESVLNETRPNPSKIRASWNPSSQFSNPARNTSSLAGSGAGAGSCAQAVAGSTQTADKIAMRMLLIAFMPTSLYRVHGDVLQINTDCVSAFRCFAEIPIHILYAPVTRPIKAADPADGHRIHPWLQHRCDVFDVQIVAAVFGKDTERYIAFPCIVNMQNYLRRIFTYLAQQCVFVAHRLPPAFRGADVKFDEVSALTCGRSYGFRRDGRVERFESAFDRLRPINGRLSAEHVIERICSAARIDAEIKRIHVLIERDSDLVEGTALYLFAARNRRTIAFQLVSVVDEHFVAHVAVGIVFRPDDARARLAFSEKTKLDECLPRTVEQFV